MGNHFETNDFTFLLVILISVLERINDFILSSFEIHTSYSTIPGNIFSQNKTTKNWACSCFCNGRIGEEVVVKEVGLLLHLAGCFLKISLQKH